MSEAQIKQHRWKYCDDDLSGAFQHSDFLHFEDGTGLYLLNDTIYRSDTVLAVVHSAYRWDGSKRLKIKLLSTGQVVEYIAI